MERINAFLLGGLLGAIPGYLVGFFLSFCFAAVMTSLRLVKASTGMLGFALALPAICTLAFAWWGGNRGMRAYDEQSPGPAGRGAGIGALFGSGLGLLGYLAILPVMLRQSEANGVVTSVSTWIFVNAAIGMIVAPGLFCAACGAVVGALSGRKEAVPSHAAPAARPGWDAGPDRAELATPAYHPHTPRSAPDADAEEVQSVVAGRILPAVLRQLGDVEWEAVEHPGPKTLVMRGHLPGVPPGPDVRVRASALRNGPTLRNVPTLRNGSTPGIGSLGLHVVVEMPQAALWPANRPLDPRWLVATGVSQDLVAHLMPQMSPSAPLGLDGPELMWQDPTDGARYTVEVNARDRIGAHTSGPAGNAPAVPGYTIVSVDMCEQATPPPAW